MHKIREIREYPPIHVLFSRWKEEKDIVFLDSSLENRLGRYSIIGRLPYQKLVQDGDSFCVNDEKQKMTFENYLRTYLIRTAMRVVCRSFPVRWAIFHMITEERKKT